jgi:acetyl esterase/lipase
MAITRRQWLLGAAGVLASPACTSSSSPGSSSAPEPAGPSSAASRPSPEGTAMPSSRTAPVRHAYGRDRSQFGELSRPEAPAKAGTVVIIHGGFWRARYNLSLGRPLAADLVRRGYVVWNLEYRRVGAGGGWTGTFDDVAAGIDKLAELDVDTSAVVAVGHSAGGQLAVWAGARPKLPADAPGADPAVQLTAAVSQAGVLDLQTAARTGVGDGAEADLLGGTPDQVPDRYRRTDPIELLPILTPVLCVHSRADQNVPFAQSTAYVAAAKDLGSEATLAEVAGDHFTLIDPSSPAWAVVVRALPGLLRQ